MLVIRAVVLGMGDGSMMTLSIADPEKKGISDYLKSLPSRNPAGCPSGPIPGIGSGYIQAECRVEHSTPLVPDLRYC